MERGRGTHAGLVQGAEGSEARDRAATGKDRVALDRSPCLGGLGVDLMAADGWEAHLSGLDAIDWSKKNPEWENVCIIANSVVSNRQARAATKAFIKAKLGLALTDGEERSLESAKTRGKSLVA